MEKELKLRKARRDGLGVEHGYSWRRHVDSRGDKHVECDDPATSEVWRRSDQQPQ